MMLRLASLWLLITVLLYADNFKHCQQNLKNSYILIENRPAIYTDQGWLVFSQTPLTKYQRSEPLLGLYLVGAQPKATPFKVLNRYPKDVAELTPNEITLNRIMHEGQGLDQLAPLENRTKLGEMLFGKCCTLRGFVASQGVVTADLISHFLLNKAKLATAGVRFDLKKGKIFVVAKNPFFAYNGLLLGDEILSLDRKKYTLYDLNKKILFSKVGTFVKFQVKRKGDIISIPIALKEKLGGGVLADTFLEHFGLRFDKDLALVSIKKKSFLSTEQLKAGDKLITINGSVMEDEKDLQNYFSKHPLGEKMSCLFERDGLQFFLHIPATFKLRLK